MVGGGEEMGEERGGYTEENHGAYGGESWRSSYGESFTLLQHSVQFPSCTLQPFFQRIVLAGLCKR